MKKHQLLLIVLLFTSNGLLITQNSENIHPASFRNIEKPDNNMLAREPNRTSFKNIEESRVSKTKLYSSKIREITKISLTIGKTSLTMGMGAMGGYFGANVGIFSLSAGCTILQANNYNPIAFIGAVAMWYPGIKYFLNRTIDIQDTCYNLVGKKHSTQEALVKFANFAGFFYGIKKMAFSAN